MNPFCQRIFELYQMVDLWRGMYFITSPVCTVKQNWSKIFSKYSNFLKHKFFGIHYARYWLRKLFLFLKLGFIWNKYFQTKISLTAPPSLSTILVYDGHHQKNMDIQKWGLRGTFMGTSPYFLRGESHYDTK